MTGGLGRRLSALERQAKEAREVYDEQQALWPMYLEAKARHDAALAEGREPAAMDQAAAEWLKICEAQPKSTMAERLTNLSEERLDGLLELYEATYGPEVTRQLEAETSPPRRTEGVPRSPGSQHGTLPFGLGCHCGSCERAVDSGGGILG